MSRPVQLVLAVLTALLAVGPSATALAADPDRVDLVARELRRDPVFVSDSFSRIVSPQEVAALRRAVARMPFPTYVVLAPGITPPGPTAIQQPSDGWAAQLRDALGRDGLYVVGKGTSPEADAFGVRPRLDGRDATLAAFFDLPEDIRPAREVLYVLGLMRGEPRLPRAERRQIPPNEGGPPFEDDRAEEDEGGGSGVWWILGGILGLPVAAVVTRRTLLRHGPGAPPRATARGRALDPGTRAEAELAVQRLATALDRATSPPERAFELAAAASVALDRDRDGELDDLGALVLAGMGLDVLRRGHADPRCFYDPRHGRAKAESRWSQDGETVAVPACRACARDIAGRRAPSALLHDGRPYWERRSVWARTGFGALDPDVGRALAQDGR
ncbi:hypothetical protein [Paraconexibacter algicola]|uniref:DUF4350 domain-containing protein n=1 Tax=Paraconexibacter algicola TaxID=2133960 RepID=A0A2T4UHK9_9ACTN|nr:hypothetical protein [Paraconexibacter algicola]PTL58685.1 hypothetical protein C7Y72_02985 [Paraconexibacter algicola]